MRNQKLISLALVWMISIILSAIITPTWLVEGTMNHLNFEFPSKEAYVLTVQIVQWISVLYFVALTFLTFYLFQRQNRWQ